MNYRLIVRLLGAILLLEALTMLPPLVIALIYGDGDAMALLISMILTMVAALPTQLFFRPEEKNLRAREGFVIVALAWVLLSAFGALPFVLSGVLPNYIDALFETVSGFTTTGSTVLEVFEGQPHGIMFWRSFTHWIGGMGVLVLTLALLAQVIGRASHLMRAESPGPEFSKILPKTGNTAKTLYLIYGALTVLEFVLLMIAGLSPYDAAIHAMGTAGTGGFSNYGASVGELGNPAVEVIVTVFMLIFSVNFALFYRTLTGHLRESLRSEELHWFLAIFGIAAIAITVIILPQYGSFGTALRYGCFQVATVMSTTGYATADFNLWPEAAKMILFLLMFVGACAGSTAGGIKVVRVALLIKQGLREVRRTFQPLRVSVVRFEGRGVEQSMLSQIAVFFFVYVALVLVGSFLLSLFGPYGFETNFTAALTCVSNVGPGFGAVGPMGNFAGFGAMGKITLILLMLAGRLEIFPILVLFHPATWKRSN